MLNPPGLSGEPFVIQTAISILTAIATALGVTSCMAAV